MANTIVNIKGTFHNLYAWGKGWLSYEQLNAWEEYWLSLNAIYWHFFQVQDCFGTTYLVSTYGSIYLHPMDFRCILNLNGGNGGPINELKKICTECAKKCGGTFTMEVEFVDITLKGGVEW